MKLRGLVGAGFGLWFVFCGLMSLVTIVGLGYAIYWALTIVERAVGG